MPDMQRLEHTQDTQDRQHTQQLNQFPKKPRNERFQELFPPTAPSLHGILQWKTLASRPDSPDPTPPKPPRPGFFLQIDILARTRDHGPRISSSATEASEAPRSHSNLLIRYLFGIPKLKLCGGIQDYVIYNYAFLREYGCFAKHYLVEIMSTCEKKQQTEKMDATLWPPHHHPQKRSSRTQSLIVVTRVWTSTRKTIHRLFLSKGSPVEPLVCWYAHALFFLKAPALEKALPLFLVCFAIALIL